MEVSFTLSLGPPELEATKTDALAADHDGNGLVSPGDHIGYENTIANVGQGDATAVVLDDSVPDHTAIVAGSVTTSHGTILSESPLEVEIGALAPEETATVTFEVTIAAPFPTDVLEVANTIKDDLDDYHDNECARRGF
ncbi:MAG: DUF11 domain-containing protein [bacterium]|nr:DUF11 domain-containing protein [bacterium]